MENQSHQTDKESDSSPLSEGPETAHELAQKMIEDENFHVSEEQMKNIDTSPSISPSSQSEADKLAENLGKDKETNSAQLIGE